MKKLIIAIVLAVVLIAGGLGGFVYATNGHTPMTGEKLVGHGFFGKAFDEDTGSYFVGSTYFWFTNPDGVSEITIDGVFILDGDGNVLYEGELLGLDGSPVSQTLGPHEQRVIELKNYLDGEAFKLVTVEIFWSGSDKRGLPLIGSQVTMIVFLDYWGNLTQQTMMDSAVPMVNMEQELMPEDED